LTSPTHAPEAFDNTLQAKGAQQFIDYCNLYIKNLDEAVTSTDLFQHFKAYGRIVSARVIVNAATNQSRGYGFVSYSRPEEAAYALSQMNGVVLGSKAILVAYHEPKKPRMLPLSPKSPNSSESGSQIFGHPSSIDSIGHDKSDLYHDLYNSVAGTGLVWDANLPQVTESLTEMPRQDQVAILTQPLALIDKVC
jgi:RNA recognition motif-containing protein